MEALAQHPQASETTSTNSIPADDDRLYDPQEILNDPKFGLLNLDDQVRLFDDQFRIAHKQLVKNESDENALWDSHREVVVRLHNDQISRIAADALPVVNELRDEGNVSFVRNKIIDYWNQTSGLVHAPTKWTPVSLSQLSEDQVDGYVNGSSQNFDLLPSEKARIRAKTDAAEQSGQQPGPIAKMIRDELDRGTGLPQFGQRDEQFEKQFAPAFDALRRMSKLETENRLTQWTTPDGAVDRDNQSLFAIRRRKIAGENAWQVRLKQQASGIDDVIDVKFPFETDFSKPEDAKLMMEVFKNEARASADKYDDSNNDLWFDLTSREKLEELLGADNRGFFGEGAALFKKHIVGTLLSIPEGVAQIGAVGEQIGHDIAKAISPDSFVNDYSPYESDNPVEGFFGRRAIEFGAMRSGVQGANSPTAEDRELGNGWMLDASAAADKIAGFASMMAQVAMTKKAPINGAVMLGIQAGATAREEYYNSAKRSGKSDVDAAKIAIYGSTVEGLVIGAAMEASGKMMINDTFRSEALRSAINSVLKTNPEIKGQFLRKATANVIGSMPGQIGSNAVPMGAARLASAFIHDQVTGGDRMNPIAQVLGPDGWDRFMQSEFGRGLVDDVVFGSFMGIGHGVLDATKTPDVFTPGLGGRFDPQGRGYYTDGKGYTVIAPDGRFARFESPDDANAFSVKMRQSHERLVANTERVDGVTRFKDNVTQAERNKMREDSEEVDAILSANANRHAMEHATDMGVGVYDSPEEATAAALNLASKFDLGQDPARAREKFVEVMRQKIASESRDWRAEEKKFLEEYDMRQAKMPTWWHEGQARVVELVNEINSTKDNPDAQAKLKDELAGLVDRLNKAQPEAPKKFSAEQKQAAWETYKRAEMEMELARAEGKANRLAEDAFGPERVPGAGVEVYIPASPTETAALQKRLIRIERVVYNDSNSGEMRTGWEVRFRQPQLGAGPLANKSAEISAQRIDYLKSKGEEAAAGRAAQSTEAQGAANAAAHEAEQARNAGLPSADEAAAERTRLSQQAASESQAAIDARVREMVQPTTNVSIPGSTPKSARESAAVMEGKPSPAMREYGAGARKGAAKAINKLYRDATKPRAKTAAKKVKPEEPVRPALEDAASRHGVEDPRKAVEDIPDNDVVKSMKVSAPRMAPEPEPKTSDNLKNLSELARSAEITEGDLVDELRAYTPTERRGIANELGGGKLSSPESLAKELVAKYKKTDPESTYEPSKPDGNDPDQSSDTVTIEDLVAAEDAQSTEAAGGLTNLGKRGRSDAGSTIIFSEIADMAVKAIKTGLSKVQFIAEAVKKYGERIRDAAGRVFDSAIEHMADRLDSPQNRINQQAAFMKANGLALRSESDIKTSKYPVDVPYDVFTRAEPDAPGRSILDDPRSASFKNTAAMFGMSPRMAERNRIVELEDRVAAGKSNDELEAELDIRRELLRSEYSAGWYDDVTKPLWKALRKIHDQLGKLALKMESWSLRFQHEAATDTKPLRDAIKALSPAEQTTWFIHTRMGDVDAINNFLADRPEMREAYKAWRGVAKRFADEAKKAGVDLGVLDEYFPSHVEDYDGLKEFLRKDARFSPGLDAAISGTIPGSADEAAAINRHIMGLAEFTPRGGQHTKSRKLEGDYARWVEMSKYFADPATAIEKYIQRMSRHIMLNRYFGTDADAIAAGVGIPNGRTVDHRSTGGGLLAELQASGEISKDGADKAVRLLNDYLKYKPSEAWLRALKSFNVVLALNSPPKAIANLQELVLVLHENGMIAGLKGLTNPRKITTKDIGLETTAELHDADGLRWMTEKVAKYSLFKPLDVFTANTQLNASLQKLAAMSDRALMAEIVPWSRFLNDTPERVMAKIRDGNWKDEDVAMLAFSKLSEIRPTSIASMPATYLRNPNGRIFYNLKTFVIHQLDYLREKTVDEIHDGISSGNYKQAKDGLVALATLGSMLVAAGSGIDEAKDFMVGRVGSMGNRTIKNFMSVTPLLLLGGTYGIDKLVQTRDLSSVVSQAVGLPFLSMIQNLWNDAANAKKNIEIGDRPWYADILDGNTRVINQIPYMDMLYYYRFAKAGIESNKRSVRRNLGSETNKWHEQYNLLSSAGKDRRKAGGKDAAYEQASRFNKVYERAMKVADHFVERSDLAQVKGVIDFLEKSARNPAGWDNDLDFLAKQLEAQ